MHGRNAAGAAAGPAAERCRGAHLGLGGRPGARAGDRLRPRRRSVRRGRDQRYDAAAARHRNVARQLYNIQLLLVAGLVVGYAATTTRRASARLTDAIAAESAAAERLRLSRSIHDGVLQVLAQVQRRGRAIGGDGGRAGGPGGRAGGRAALADHQRAAGHIGVRRVRPRRGAAGARHHPGRGGAAGRSGTVASRNGRRAGRGGDRGTGERGPARGPGCPGLGGARGPRRRGAGRGARRRCRHARAERLDAPWPTAGSASASPSVAGLADLGGDVAVRTAPGEGTEWELRVEQPAEHSG